MTVYYVNSSFGSDKNAGTSADHALASLGAVNALKLKAGDSVLFAAGTEYNGQLTVKYSGAVGSPITYGSYGDGNKPLIYGGSVGVSGSKTSHIVLDNLAIEKTAGNAVYAGNATDWTLNKVSVTDTGSSQKAGSISFQNSVGIAIVNSKISSTYGDGVWMLNVKGATLTGNTVTRALGHDADAIQLNGSSNISITNNHLDMSGNTGSAKGVLTLVDVKGAAIDGNVLSGGGFGISAMGQDIAITHNEISGYGGYDWSYGIGLGQQVDAKNYQISGNYVHGGVWGVSVSSPGTDHLTRTGIDISHNLFADMSSAALKVDRAASGTYHDNLITKGVHADIFISKAVAGLGTFVLTASGLAQEQVKDLGTLDGRGWPSVPSTSTVQTPGTTTAPAKDVRDIATVPSDKATTSLTGGTVVAKNDTLIFNHVDVKALHGNVLSNDLSANGALYLRNLNGLSFKGHPDMNVDGKYGVLHIKENGDFTYSLDHPNVHSSGTVTESFQYKVSDGHSLDVGHITVSIDTSVMFHSINPDILY